MMRPVTKPAKELDEKTQQRLDLINDKIKQLTNTLKDLDKQAILNHKKYAEIHIKNLMRN